MLTPRVVNPARPALLLALLLCSALPACKSRPPSSSASSSPTPSPAFNPDAGLTLLRFTLPRHHPALAEVFSQSAPPPAHLTDLDINALAADGFRIAFVPRASLESILSQMPVESGVVSMAIGPAPDWREIAAGSTLPEPRSYLISGASQSLPRGRLRLIIRNYRLLTLTGPLLHLDLVAQLHQPKPDPFHPDPVAENARGIFFHSASLSIDLDGSLALFIAAEKPGTQWIALTDADAQSPPLSTPAPQVLGPNEAAPLLTLGEDILMDDRANLHEILVLLPTPSNRASGPAPKPL